MVFLNDIKKYLIENGITYPIFVGNLPVKPNNCITLFEYQGLPDELQAETTSPGLQLLLRVDNENYELGYEELYKATRILERVGFEDGELPDGVTINGTKYFCIYSNGSGFNQLGKDENGSSIMTTNFYVIKEK